MIDLKKVKYLIEELNDMYEELAIIKANNEEGTLTWKEAKETISDIEVTIRTLQDLEYIVNFVNINGE